MKDAIADGACWSLQQLAVSGGDLIKLGAVPGPAIGSILDEMLELVIEGKLQNTSRSSLNYARGRAVQRQEMFGQYTSARRAARGG